MGTRMIRSVGAAALAVATLVLAAGPAAAHEERKVGGLEMAVGFGQEPAYAGEPNSVQLLLHQGGQPVTDLGDSLKVTVGFGDSSKDLSIEPNFEIGEFGTPGDYRAWFIPTRSGTYSFHFTGSVGKTEIDETFTSGPKTFSDVVSPSDVEFPVQDPTTGELAERIDREVPRLRSSIQDATRAASDEASNARTLGLIGIVVGALGLIAGIGGIAAARRKPV
jgi:hypothetical protein